MLQVIYTQPHTTVALQYCRESCPHAARVVCQCLCNSSFFCYRHCGSFPSFPNSDPQCHHRRRRGVGCLLQEGSTECVILLRALLLENMGTKYCTKFQLSPISLLYYAVVVFSVPVQKLRIIIVTAMRRRRGSTKVVY